MKQTGILITLQSGEVVVVSNEELKSGDYHLYKNSVIDKTNDILISNIKVCDLDNDYKKILLASSSLNLEGIPQLDMEHYNREMGIVDVEKLAREFATKPVNPLNPNGTITCLLSQNGFEKGANAILEANKEKMYTREDMEKCYEGVLQNVGTCVKQSDLPTFKEYIEWISQPLVEWEVEEVNVGVTEDGNNYITELQPKTNAKGLVEVKKGK